ncbi:hypothetical protein JKA73_29270 [Myxococcus xanthus]|uniref:lipase secretion chaperone n=1 Tax=Myxococcus xanthus TaxID=34 RepID=UPI001917017B|nr:lipase secretion chaperone [Myxococcus xanthus]QQR43109.1 hypothetical protein JKA73_29270 [Myxococcus xanthus]
MRLQANRVLGASAAILGLLLGWRILPVGQTAGAPPAPGPVSSQGRSSPTLVGAPASRAPPTPGAVNAAAPAAESLALELEVLRLSLLERFGSRLHEPSVQLRMLEQLMRYFQTRSPDRWREELQTFLRRAFPGQYEALATLLRDRLDYEKWVKDNDTYLRGLDSKQRRAAVWDARNRLFGKETAQSLWASELKHQALVDALQVIDARQDLPLSEKLSAYKARLGEVYGDGAPAQLARHSQETMNRFLALPSVQRELTGMTPAERARSLWAVRQEMGLNDEALRRWDALDQTRDARWEAGLRYMAERATLARALSGDALEARLQEVRARYFGTEADVIAQEEASGLFRFTRPRQWGRN